MVRILRRIKHFRLLHIRGTESKNLAVFFLFCFFTDSEREKDRGRDEWWFHHPTRCESEVTPGQHKSSQILEWLQTEQGHIHTRTCTHIYAYIYTYVTLFQNSKSPFKSLLEKIKINKKTDCAALITHRAWARFNLNQKELQIISCMNRWFLSENCIFQTFLDCLRFSPSLFGVIMIITPPAFGDFILFLWALSQLRLCWPIPKKCPQLGPFISIKVLIHLNTYMP